MEAAHEKSGRDRAPAGLSSLKRQKQCPAMGRLPVHSLTADSLLRNCRCEAFTSRSFFRLKPGPVSWVLSRGPATTPDRVRLALPRSPESGFAVSAHAKCLSREKR